MFKSAVAIALGLMMGVTGANAQNQLPQGTIFYQFFNRRNDWASAAPGRNFNAQITRTAILGGPQLVGVDCYGITFDPGTRQMCFARNRRVSGGKGEQNVFYLSNLDGTNAHLLQRERIDYSGQSGLVSDYTPFYASNGDLLFETGDRVARMNGDGSNVRFITGESENCGLPSESRGIISFEKSGVCVCDEQGKNRRRIASFRTYYGAGEGGRGTYTDARVSPDGKQIVYGRDDQIFVAPLDEQGVPISRQVSNASSPMNFSDPVWSPDGSFLAVAGAPRGSSSHDIYLINLSTNQLSRLTRTPEDELPSDWRLVL